jgi:PadR family transcriptional regulator PadR
MSSHLGEFEQLILFALVSLGDDAYGVSIRREIESRAGRAVSTGAVYTALERLEGRGYVASWVGEPTPQRGGRRKKHYRIEPNGAAALSRAYQTLRRMADGLAGRLAELSVSRDGVGKE